MADLLGQFKPVGEKKWVKYSPKQKLGSGQFSKVYKGIYNNNKHFVAVKLIEHSERESNEAAIHQEQQLHHKNIVKFIFDDVHVADDVEKYVIVMELCDYTFDIFSRPAECAAINPLDAILGAAHGLHYLHTKNILHCDVKPSNILLKKERDHWVAKLSDFGLSRKQPKLNQQYGSITGPSGTLAYNPYEGKGKNPKVDKPWDVYAFGLVIFFVITNGKHPFGDDFLSIIQNVTNREKPNFSLLETAEEPWKNINGKFMDLLSSMLSHDKNERPTMTQLLGYHLFWEPKKCIDFVQYVSDCLKGIRDKKGASMDAEKNFMISIQKLSKKICNNDWATPLKDVISKTGQPNQKRYKAKNDVYELLKIIRDWNHHYSDRTATDEFRKELGELPYGFWEYFSSRFPTLIPHIYRATKTFYEESKNSGMQSWTRRSYDVIIPHTDRM